MVPFHPYQIEIGQGVVIIVANGSADLAATVLEARCRRTAAELPFAIVAEQIGLPDLPLLIEPGHDRIYIPVVVEIR